MRHVIAILTTVVATAGCSFGPDKSTYVPYAESGPLVKNYAEELFPNAASGTSLARYEEEIEP